MCEALESEQKKLADLVQQQNRLLEKAVKFRTLMEEKIETQISPQTSFDESADHEPSDIRSIIIWGRF